MSTAIDFASALAIAKKGGKRIARDTFLYMVPRADASRDKFAQCSQCRDFVKGKKRCAILGNTEVLAGDSCGAFVEGKYSGQPIRALTTPEAVGLVSRAVRCENCKYGGKTCGLYKMLNDALPDVFDLDTKIEPQACCNAQTPKT